MEWCGCALVGRKLLKGKMKAKDLYYYNIYVT